MENRDVLDVVCIGAGPAGLTAAYRLSQMKKSCLVLEKDPEYVGGISRTVCYKGYRFDIGGHRFFSKSEQIEALWEEILGDDFIERPRKSRIFYRKQFFSYPLKPFEALFKLGIWESILSVGSYLWYKIFPVRPVTSFEAWVTNQFGRRLFRIFFKTYTEKVWGIPTDEISADWAAQRIKGLSLLSAIKAAFTYKGQSGSSQIKTLITSFRYPRLGPGQMWEVAAEKIEAMGGHVSMGSEVSALHYDTDNKVWEITYRTLEHASHRIFAKDLISSMPMRELAYAVTPTMPPAVLDAASKLKYRDFLIVALMVNTEGDFDDNWVYIHDETVKVGRIQNFRSWSEEMIPHRNHNCYGLEYFCFEGDGLWNMKDEALIALAKTEILQIGLVQSEDIIEGHVIRQPKAYPVYDADYKQHIQVIKQHLQAHYPSLHLVGRNGMHKYNNQDHAMMTALLTAENIQKGTQYYDTWQVNEDAEYHETQDNTSTNTVTARLVPERDAK